MNVCLSGLMRRCIEELNRHRDSKDLAFMLQELQKHLEQLRDDPKLIDDFFKLYVK